MLLAAVWARNEKLALVGLFVGLFNSRETLNRRRSAVNHLRSGEGLGSFNQQRDRVALLLDVCHAVVRLFHADHRRRRRLHA